MTRSRSDKDIFLSTDRPMYNSRLIEAVNEGERYPCRDVKIIMSAAIPIHPVGGVITDQESELHTTIAKTASVV